MLDNPQADKSAPMVRNGNRWRVAAIDDENYRVAAVRLDDGAGAVFTGDYLREHINLGYAVTVHSAQGVTADASHAVLGESTIRNLLYVAMTRGRHTNTAHLYERITGTSEQPTTNAPLVRGNSMEAAQFVRSVIARDSSPRTAHEVASQTGPAELPTRIAEFAQRYAHAVQSRRQGFETGQAADKLLQERHATRERGVGLGRDSGDSLDL